MPTRMTNYKTFYWKGSRSKIFFVYINIIFFFFLVNSIKKTDIDDSIKQDEFAEYTLFVIYNKMFASNFVPLIRNLRACGWLINRV